MYGDANDHSAIFNDPEKLRVEYPVPVCQCVQIKPLAAQTAGAPERFRIVLSDIKNFVQSMLATGNCRLRKPSVQIDAGLTFWQAPTT
jgi:hypothetical protein